jgi:RNA polymerase sigma-70 factor (ECF subfamily)
MSFDEAVLPHLNAGHALARWLMRNDDDAEDVVQEASLRALRYFATFDGSDGRAWFLRIVRNTCWSWHNRTAPPTDAFDEELHSSVQPAFDPEALALRTDEGRLIEQALSELTDRSRELLVRREFDGLSYRELADAMDVPIGTVMSGLSRAREAFRAALTRELKQSGFRTRNDPRERADNNEEGTNDDEDSVGCGVGSGSARAGHGA